MCCVESTRTVFSQVVETRDVPRLRTENASKGPTPPHERSNSHYFTSLERLESLPRAWKRCFLIEV